MIAAQKLLLVRFAMLGEPISGALAGHAHGSVSSVEEALIIDHETRIRVREGIVRVT